MYKKELNLKNRKSLNKKLDEDNVPIFIRDYFNNIRNGGTGVNSYVAIKDLLLYLIDSQIIRKSSIAEITPEDFKNITAGIITSYLGDKEDSGELAPTTLHTRKYVYRGFWRYLKKSPLSPITENIIEEVKYEGLPYDVTNRIKKCPSDEQVKEMFTNIRNNRSYLSKVRNNALLTFMVGSGVRVGEIANMDLKDLYLDKCLYIKEGGAPFVKVLGKRHDYESNKRKVFLTGSAAKALRDWIRIRGSIPTKEESVFITSKGKRLTETSIKWIFRKNSTMTPHQIRHYYTTKMVDKCGYFFTEQNLGHEIEGSGSQYINGLTDEIKEVLKTL